MIPRKAGCGCTTQGQQGWTDLFPKYAGHVESIAWDMPTRR